MYYTIVHFTSPCHSTLHYPILHYTIIYYTTLHYRILTMIYDILTQTYILCSHIFYIVFGIYGNY